MSAYKFIYEKLLAGEMFGSIEKHRMGGAYFWDVLYADKLYIHWRHYGQSANKLSLKSLKWILDNIFKMKPEEFLYTYVTQKQYKQIDSYYEGNENDA